MSQYKKFTITLTFSTRGENHVGSQKIGKMEKGFGVDIFENNKNGMQIFNLGENVADASKLGAYLGHIPNFCSDIENELTKELVSLYWDRHLWSSRMTEVQNKHARANALFAYKNLDKSFSNPKPRDFSNDREKINDLKKIPEEEAEEEKKIREKNISKREKGLEATLFANSAIQKLGIGNLLLQYPDYDNIGKGCVYDIERLPFLDKLCKKVIKYCKEIGYDFSDDGFIAEGNFYFDVDETYIGFHGDAERKAVFGVRLGSCDMPLFYGWWKNSNYIQNSMKGFLIRSGSAYIMSEKAVGTDWMKRSDNLMTLRHSAGNIFTLLKEDVFKTILEKDGQFLVRVCDKKEISFPIPGTEDLILSKFLSVFVQEKTENRVESNWLKKYKLSKKNNNDE